MNDDKILKENIKNLTFEEALGERYVSYAMSTIVSRSLPDVRDGLKPVHRRLLYAMRELKLNPQSGFKKCARVVGDVIGKYHPHGDQSVYDAMVRLAQDFSVRYPLVDGQGNFGNVDGDNAAAMRYTEARLTNIAELLLKDIDNDTVDFISTYDGEETEPVVMPSLFPNLLANGATGIAVGMATNIPSHNIIEILKAIRHLVKSPNAKVSSLLNYIKGPDFPTGGTIVNTEEEINRAYELGKGIFKLRSNWHLENKKHGQYNIIIDDLPWNVTKSRVIDNILELISAKKLTMLSDIKDESTEEIRIVIFPKNRDIVPEQLMGALFNYSDLEIRVSLNMNVVDKNQVPKTMDLKEILCSFIEHRKEVILRAAKKRLKEIKNRKEILEGYLITFLNLEAVIKIIREKDDPKIVIMKRFKLSDLQAESLLNLRLRSLRKLEEDDIKKEMINIISEIKSLNSLISSDKLVFSKIDSDMKGLISDFSKIKSISNRRTIIKPLVGEKYFSAKEFVKEEDVTFIISKNNWIRIIKGKISENKVINYKEGDNEKFLIEAKNNDKIILASNKGKIFCLDLQNFEFSKGFGEPIRLILDLPSDHDIIYTDKVIEENQVLLVSKSGKGFIVPKMSDLISYKKVGKTIMNLFEADEVKVVRTISNEKNHIALLGSNKKLLILPLSDLPIQKRGKGVILQRIKNGYLSDCIVFNIENGIEVSTKSKKRKYKDLQFWVGKRSQSGKIIPKGFPRSNVFSY